MTKYLVQPVRFCNNRFVSCIVQIMKTVGHGFNENPILPEPVHTIPGLVGEKSLNGVSIMHQ